MKPDLSYIRQLMTERLAGIIREEDSQYLENHITSDPDVKGEWDRLQAQFKNEDIKEQFKRFKPSELLKLKEDTLMPQRQYGSYLRLLPVAAAILTLILVGGYWLQDRNDTQGQSNIAIIKKAPKIQLRLANGQEINLSHVQKDTTVSGAQLLLDEKLLSYKSSSAIDNGINTLTVPNGLDYKINLSDGTEIWLNSSTTLKFPFQFSDTAREVSISGEAYLKVAKNTIPFVVRLLSGPAGADKLKNETVVRVLGTEFNVNTYDTGTVRVALVEGAVKLMNPGRKSIRLRPGQESIYKIGGETEVQHFDATDVLSWRQGFHYFQDAQLKEVCNVLYRWYGINVVIDKPSLAKKRFTGLIDKKEPVEEFLTNLKISAAINEYNFAAESILHLK